MKESDVMERVAEHVYQVDKWCEEHGYTLIVTYAIGSWNYGLGEEDSDVDTRSLVMPNFVTEVLCPNTFKDGTTIYMENGEHCSILDVRKGIKSYYKQCITATEGLFSPYWIANDDYKDFWIQLRELREEICRTHPTLFVDSSFGYMQSMLRRFKTEKSTKALMHAYRMKFILDSLKNDPDQKFEDMIDLSFERDMFLDIKHTQNPIFIETLEQNLKEYINEVNIMMTRKTFERWESQDNEKVYKAVDKLLVKLFEKVWKKEI